jgi:hypothetical protein
LYEFHIYPMKSLKRIPKSHETIPLILSNQRHPLLGTLNLSFSPIINTCFFDYFCLETGGVRPHGWRYRIDRAMCKSKTPPPPLGTLNMSFSIIITTCFIACFCLETGDESVIRKYHACFCLETGDESVIREYRACCFV